SKPRDSVWREQALAEIAARRFTTDRFEAQIGGERAKRIRDVLAAAKDAATSNGFGVVARWRGSALERIWGQINGADEALMQVAPDEYVRAQIPRLRRRVESLPAGDERRKGLDAMDAASRLTPEMREELTSILHSVNGDARKAQTRVRS